MPAGDAPKPPGFQRLRAAVRPGDGTKPVIVYQGVARDALVEGQPPQLGRNNTVPFQMTSSSILRREPLARPSARRLTNRHSLL